MGKISVVYWSQSGNTLAMAEAIGKGITDGGAQAEVVNVSSCQVSDLDTEEVFALGCPAMRSLESALRKVRWSHLLQNLREM